MFARSTTIQAHPSRIDAGVAHIRSEAIPRLQAMPGFVGLSLLVDRDTGQCIATSAWDGAEALAAGADAVGPIREDAVAAFGGTCIAIEDWEVAVLHRDHPGGAGACVRATWIKVVPDRIRHALDFYRTEVLPALERLDGFCSASLLIDRGARRAVSSTTFDGFAALDRNRDAAIALRTARLRELGAEAVDVAEFELAVAGLGVPELV